MSDLVRDAALVAVVFSVLAPATAVALLTDTGAAGNNGVSGGVLDLKLSEVGPPTQDGTADERTADDVVDTWEDRSHATDGSEIVENELALNNSASSIAADRVNVTVAFAENDTDLGSGGNANATARTVEVTRFVYDGTDLVGSSLTDMNGNGIVDVADTTNGSNAENLSSLSGVGASGIVSVNASLSGRADLLSGVGSADGIDVEVRIRVHARGYADRDVSRNNTIRYQ
ncbi:hypothetical protein [Halorussus sp. AFM4]|uniref:hypothetical protein n=1 Tax=Halorussus sp. AFM4 TaxID=3421651 RepID=UPI003EC137EC